MEAVADASYIRLVVDEDTEDDEAEDWDKESLEASDGEEPPTFSPITLESLPLPEDGRVGVVGESYYQQALRLVADGRVAGRDFEGHLPVTAALIPEPANRWDKNAVRVDVVLGPQTVKVGYLSRGLAKEYQPELLKFQTGGFIATCPARVSGGGERFYGIYLHVVYPRDLRVASGSEDPVIAFEKEGVAFLRSNWSCTVTKEEDHQDILGRYAPTGTQEFRRLAVSLGFCEIAGGKYRGQDAIEVRVGGQRVGQLTYAMSGRYGSIVSAVLDRGLVPKCEAFTMNTKKGVQIELRMPPDPGRSPKQTPWPRRILDD